MEDRHLGRNSPVFTIEGHPDKFINLINYHGVLARIVRARKCPCGGSQGGPVMHCKLCQGDGFVYDYQRKMLQLDEDSDVRGQSHIVFPFRVPVIEPLKVERLIASEQGGIAKYNIVSFDTESITISSNGIHRLPRHYEKMRVSYYFDRFTKVTGERVTVNPSRRLLTTTTTLYNGEHRFGNAQNMHGDVTIVDKIYHEDTGYEFTDYTYKRNQIHLNKSEPEPEVGKILVDYYYAPPVRVLPADLDFREEKETWTSNITSGLTRIGVEPWWELGPGDLITLLPFELFRDQALVHGAHGIDRLVEFDVAYLDDEIFDQDGERYRKNEDFELQDFHNIVWIGNQPNPGKHISVRYSYRPTYVIFQDQPVPNAMENKKFPLTFNVKLYNRTIHKEEKVFKPIEFPGLNL